MREMEEIEKSLMKWSLVIIAINRVTFLNQPHREQHLTWHEKQAEVRQDTQQWGLEDRD